MELSCDILSKSRKKARAQSEWPRKEKKKKTNAKTIQVLWLSWNFVNFKLIKTEIC